MSTPFIIIFILLAFNLYLLITRRAKIKKDAKKYSDEKRYAEKQYDEIQRRLKLEQEDALRRVELRDKTIELFLRYRKELENKESESGGSNDSETNQD